MVTAPCLTYRMLAKPDWQSKGSKLHSVVLKLHATTQGHATLSSHPKVDRNRRESYDNYCWRA